MLCLYVLCMAGRKEEAERIVSERRADPRKATVPAEYWAG
jgi:hypothetical protein